MQGDGRTPPCLMPLSASLQREETRRSENQAEEGPHK